ncbi:MULTISPECIES: UxaA family hydrolase [Bacillota]|jgi:altronate dehydratase small subunit|uniref:UxaA family hydrolase n=1 Tax=Clostridium tertium TaxID=1559 RepID=A0A9X3XLQ2_9CLOT|nr:MULTISPECIES: UxaA family hydrolase [Bacillota]MBP1869887.1 altronate dehydratase small subunit [Clostridium tertium]MBS4958843.1 UxaA family hydrolase [Clostridium sp.]MBU6135327.1 UxaA family hydrolase [Clostridium tertium]MDB1940496.1 UxaA family hydrolase [Clostridium tertium]MDB1949378.1 UxaA family hydrolase [Clostridium tertium]
MINSMIIDENDNVIVAIEAIKKGSDVNYKLNGEVKTIIAMEDIKIYHKVSIREIKKGEPILKYGEHIGIAGKDIEIGMHVHVHNIESHREEL